MDLSHRQGGGMANLRPTHFKRMCGADVVVFESAFEDLVRHTSTPASAHLLPPSTPASASAAASADDEHVIAAMLSAVGGTAPELRAKLATYATRLRHLLTEWQRCKDERTSRPWRAIFLLGAPPRASTATSATRPPRACVEARRTRAAAPDAHAIDAANALARTLVRRAGFEVFDPAGATLHADPRWFGEGAAGEAAEREPPRVRHAEPLADLLAQMLINQLCSGTAS
jgi:hypothetical protein